MANNTWNFTCDWRVGDKEGDSGFGTGNNGASALPSYVSVPFDDEITVIFPFLLRGKVGGEGTDNDGYPQVLFTIGEAGEFADNGSYSIANMADTHRFMLDVRHRRAGVGTEQSDIRLLVRDRTGGSGMHWDVIYGDNDGTSWLQTDKWYQMAISLNTSAVHVYINNALPTSTITSSTLGAANLGAGRFWLNSYTTGQFGLTGNSGQGDYGHRSFIVGPTLIDDRYINLSDPAVRARIYDSNGDFKNPGKNGSLWLGDSYDESVPLIYLPTGWVHRDFGRAGYTYTEHGTNSDGEFGGLRKDHE